MRIQNPEYTSIVLIFCWKATYHNQAISEQPRAYIMGYSIQSS
jgi:hypothetical protein